MIKSKTFILLAILIAFVNVGFAQKAILNKHHKRITAKIHPHVDKLKAPAKADLANNTKNRNFDKLLVILIDFQAEDSPYTTGNGKFLLEQDANWKTTIGSPPHNREYFEQNMEALRYYYLAVSQGLYNLQYEVFPKDKAAYTMPQTMSYYNPPNAGSELFVSRMEEYFKTAFETADADDPQINFSDYAHYMIIHAGSDWQHDILGDSPSDIPSFFIRVGEGKEAIVDNGTTTISHACNVPSTISQDFGIYTEGDTQYHTGYGALNAVIAHEFGHSLGLVDLYNVYNFRTMVGSFDIMDSGGNGVLIDQAEDGSYVFVEGVLPALPGAFSRELLFGELFEERGYLKDLKDLELYTNVNIRASSSKQNPLIPQPSIVRIPINQTEYILLENRSVDPDGDGNTAVYGSLDNRVILYPTARNDDTNQATYEYDYLLPSFVSANGASIGGGILAWHIDNDIIYNQGNIGSDGNFYSNFENNSVNIAYSRRGVKIIEADALPDIGNQYSYYWTGTAYEYFHKNRAILDNDGFFVNWSQSPWTPILGADTNPPLTDNQGTPSMYSIKFLGNPAALMTISIESAFFNQSSRLSFFDNNAYALPMINSSFSQNVELPVISESQLHLYTNSFQNNAVAWQDLYGAFEHNMGFADHPIIVSDINRNSFMELVHTRANKLSTIEFANDDMQINQYLVDANISCSPLYLDNALWVSTGQKIYRMPQSVSGSFEIAGALRLAGIRDHLAILRQNDLLIYDTQSMQQLESITIPDACGDYEPIIIADHESLEYEVFVMANNGNIYRYAHSILERVFELNTQNEKPTQLGLTQFSGKTVLFFAQGSKVYAMYKNGTLVNKFPRYFENYSFRPHAHPKALFLNDTDIIMLPVAQKGYLAISNEAEILRAYSMNWKQGSREDYFALDQGNSKLYWVESADQGMVSVYSYNINPNDALYWNGFRNMGSGVFIDSGIMEQMPNEQHFTAFVFPNPVNSGQMRIRLVDARSRTSINIFDVSGNRIFKTEVDNPYMLHNDVQIDTRKFASGVYVAVVESGKNVVRIKFGVQK